MQVIKSHSSQLKQKTKLLAHPLEKNVREKGSYRNVCLRDSSVLFHLCWTLLLIICFFFRLPTDPLHRVRDITASSFLLESSMEKELQTQGGPLIGSA